MEEKYIRREDVQTMREFLKSVGQDHQTNAQGYLYFTSDEVLDFFDSAEIASQFGFCWPDFGSRRKYARESQHHTELLDLGHSYKNKTAYIDRVLQVLHKIRPDMDHTNVRVTFLEEVHEVGAECKKPRIINWKGIIESNLYFGVILRERGFTDEQLLSYLEKTTLIELSCALDLPLYETTAMLQDIKFADGTFESDRWAPSLLDFDIIAPPLFGSAQGKSQLHAWREYAGANRRANSPEAKKRANNTGRNAANDDDWFNWRELSSRRGWEVKPGKAFYDDAKFDQYIKLLWSCMIKEREMTLMPTNAYSPTTLALMRMDK